MHTCQVDPPHFSRAPVALAGLVVVVDAVDANLEHRSADGAEHGSPRPCGILVRHVDLSRACVALCLCVRGRILSAGDTTRVLLAFLTSALPYINLFQGGFAVCCLPGTAV